MFIQLETRTQYKNKNASIGRTASGVNIFISYNTIIAAEAPGVTFITSGYYSNTTAHHKTDACRYFNNAQEIEVTPEALYLFVEGRITAADIINEHKEKTQLIKLIDLNFNYKETAWRNDFPTAYDTARTLEKLETRTKTKDFKNGNHKTIKYYRTNFKYVSNFNFKVTNHTFKKRYKAAAALTIGAQPAKGGTYYQTKTKAVIYS